MTVRVTTLKGADAGDYYVEQLPNYYLQSGEPRGIWFGQGAQTLGLTGDVDDEAFVALMAGMDPTRPLSPISTQSEGSIQHSIDWRCSSDGYLVGFGATGQKALSPERVT